MIVPELSNSVNVTELTLARQAALEAARQEKAKQYDPATQLPHNQTEHAVWLAYWRPFWAEQQREEQRSAGRTHFELGLPLDTCTTQLMRDGWQDAEAEFEEWLSDGDLLYRPYSQEELR